MKTRNIDIIPGTEIDYENGLYCLYGTLKGKITHYQFMDEGGVWLYYCSSLDFIKGQTEDNIDSILVNNKPSFSIDELINFNGFDKLYYYDRDKHILRDYNGGLISMQVKLPYTFILDNRKACQSIVNSFDLKYLKDISIEKAFGGYNNNIDTWVLKFDVILPTSLYCEIMTKYDNLSDEAKNEVLKSIKIKLYGKN